MTAAITPSRLDGALSPAASRSTKTIMAAFVVVVGLYVAARLWRLTSYGLYGDEAFSLWLAKSDWAALFSYVVTDAVHPPLFYLLLKIWVGAGGESVLWLKLLPALTSIVTLPPFLLLCRELRLGRETALLALALMAVNEYLVIYAQELRMYSLLLLFAVCSLWLFARLVNLPKAPRSLHLWLLLANLLLVYTHYYGWLIVGAELVFLTIWDRNKAPAFLIASAALVACFAPWAYSVYQAAVAKGGLGGNLGWNLRPGVKEVVWWYMNLNGPISYRWEIYGPLYFVFLAIYPPLLILFTYALVRYGRQATGGGRARGFWWLATFSFLPAVVSFAASHLLGHSVWGIRYLIISAPAYMILLAASATSLPWPSLKRATIFLLLAWAGLSGATELGNREKMALEPLVRRMIEAEPESQVKVYVDDGNVASTLRFYLERANETRFDIEYVPDFAEVEGDHFWVAYLKYRTDNKGSIQDQLASGGYLIGDLHKAESPGHKVFLFPVWRGGR